MTMNNTMIEKIGSSAVCVGMMALGTIGSVITFALWKKSVESGATLIATAAESLVDVWAEG